MSRGTGGQTYHVAGASHKAPAEVVLCDAVEVVAHLISLVTGRAGSAPGMFPPGTRSGERTKVTPTNYTIQYVGGGRGICGYQNGENGGAGQALSVRAMVRPFQAPRPVKDHTMELIMMAIR